MKNFKNILLTGILLGGVGQINAAAKGKLSDLRAKKTAQKYTLTKISQVAPAPATATAACCAPATAKAACALQDQTGPDGIFMKHHEDTQNIKFLLPSSEPARSAFRADSEQDLPLSTFKPGNTTRDIIKGKVTSPTEVAWIGYHINKQKPLIASCSCFSIANNIQIQDNVGSIIVVQVLNPKYKDYVLKTVKPLLKDIFQKNRCNKIAICGRSLTHIAYADMTAHPITKPIQPGDKVPFK